jgi:enoyl-CoA hydratase/carnithine racemase
VPTQFQSNDAGSHREIRLTSADETNRLTITLILSLTEALLAMREGAKPLIFMGGPSFFSAGANLSEIQTLSAPAAFDFAKAGQLLMTAIVNFPAPVYAAIRGYCMGGGLDLALACHRRIAAPNAVLGHRGAALGLVTGWGGTQRLPRLVGKSTALAMFVAAEKIDASQALRIGLIDGIADDPVAEAVRQIQFALAHHG